MERREAEPREVIIFRPEAARELAADVRYHDEKYPGRGQRSQALSKEKPGADQCAGGALGGAGLAAGPGAASVAGAASAAGRRMPTIRWFSSRNRAALALTWALVTRRSAASRSLLRAKSS
jgi:hypothetical protein